MTQELHAAATYRAPALAVTAGAAGTVRTGWLRARATTVAALFSDIRNATRDPAAARGIT